MKPNITPVSRGLRPLRLLPVAFALVLLHGPLAGANPSPATNPPAKRYTLYLGADLAIERNGRLCPVQAVDGDSFVINADGKRVLVSTRTSDNLKIRIDSAMKITTAYASITQLKADRAYTLANNPQQQDLQVMALRNDAAAAADQALASLNRTQTVYNYENSESAQETFPGAPAPEHTVSQIDIDSATAALERAYSLQGSDVYSAADSSSRQFAERYDALALSFDVASLKPMTDPYMVVVVRFLENPDEPKSARLLIYAQSLPPINPQARSIRLFRGGFPPGYKLENYQIHLYNHGVEVATSAAPKQMQISSDEAFQYSNLEYTINNKDKTLPPAPTKAFWPADLRSRLAAGKLEHTVYVKVGRDGHASAMFEDEACTRQVNDADLEAVRNELRFHPALANGKPVEGVVAVNFDQ